MKAQNDHSRFKPVTEEINKVLINMFGKLYVC